MEASSSSNSSEYEYEDENLFLYGFFDSRDDILEEVKHLVESGTSVNAKYTNDTTLLHEAVERNNLPVFEYLMSRDEIDVNARNIYESTPLHLAISHVGLDWIKRLVEKGADVSLKDRWGNTPLFYTSGKHDLDKFEYLMSIKEIDVNVRNKTGQSPLRVAIENDNFDMVNSLTKAGADINCLDNKENTILHVAVYRNNLRLFEYSLSFDEMDVNASNNEGSTPLHFAVCYAGLDRVERLVERGADVGLKDDRANTPLHHAIQKDNLEIFEYLLSLKGIDVNAQNRDGTTLLFQAVHRRRVNLAKRLIELGADVNLYKSEYEYDDLYNFFKFYSCPPLHLAANQPEMCRLLIENGADVDATNKDGESALHYAVCKACLECVSMLLYFNADANIPKENNEIPFHCSLKCKNAEMQRMLLDYVVDFNAETSDGELILELAVKYQSPFVFDIIERGADLDSVESQRVYLSILNQKPVNLQIIVNVWSQLKGTVDMTLIFDNLEIDDQKKFIHSIIEGENFELVVNSFTKCDDLAQFIREFSGNNLKLDQLTKLICRLLSEGYELTANDVNQVYCNYGYCELFKIFLNMSTEKCSWYGWLLVPRLIFDFRSDINKVMEMKRFMKKDEIEQALEYTANSALINYYLDKYEEEKSAKVSSLPKVPSLLELARNEVRKRVADVFNCQNSCQFYTRINYLNIPVGCKEILTFQRKLYKF